MVEFQINQCLTQTSNKQVDFLRRIASSFAFSTKLESIWPNGYTKTLMVIYSIYFETVSEYIDLCMRQLYGMR